MIPGRQIASAKSWLVHAAVDRTARLLPWGVEDGPRLSPVEASTAILSHLKAAWAHDRPESGALERASIVVTVPASFDEEARELTVEAARAAGLPAVVLLEEPIAALYAWIARHRRDASTMLADGALVLVCDIGGGTTDFSLMRASIDGGEVRFERVAIGEHLLLGGDNLDLALAALVEGKLTAESASRLTITQRLTLRRRCCAAKEHLLSTTDDLVRITILGTGRGVVGGGMTADLTREEATATLLEGFLPLTAADDLPARDRRVALRELGLPYEAEPAITKHLASFLSRAGRDGGPGAARPSAVLFNGGFFTPALARTRLLDALESWIGSRPAVLENEHPESAVAIGAAFYARVKSQPRTARQLLIKAGSARSYYVALQSATPDAAVTAVCVLPRGTQEGTTLDLDRAFTVTANQPVSFTIYSSHHRTDAPDDIVTFSEDDDVQRLSPLVTVLRYGKRSRRVPLGVSLRVTFTETGTLELWCRSRSTDHSWRLAFNLRGVDSGTLEADSDDEPESETTDQAVVDTGAVAQAAALVRRTFGSPGADPELPPEALVAEIEGAIGFGKQAWPLAVIRQLADVLLEMSAGRTRTPAHETRWLNLTGFCVRPGFGATADAWRISELREIYAAGLTFPREVQGQVEWLVLWQRAGAGFTAGHQRELAQRVAGQLGLSDRKAPRLNPQFEREAWRLLASLERLDAGQRVRLGDALMDRLKRDLRNAALLWAIGRFGARTPLYGPLSSVVAPSVAGRWIERLVAKPLGDDGKAAVIQLGALTSDQARDLPEDLRGRLASTLIAMGALEEDVRPLIEIVPARHADQSRLFGEALPEGLRLEIDA